MSEDRYVIVYRNGWVGEARPLAESDFYLKVQSYDPLPAYRIRCREKARGQIKLDDTIVHTVPVKFLLGSVDFRALPFIHRRKNTA